MHGQTFTSPNTASAREDGPLDRFEVLSGAKAAELCSFIEDSDLAGLIEMVERILSHELAAAREALSRRDFEHAAESLHKMHGTAANYGMKPVSDEAKSLQERLRKPAHQGGRWDTARLEDLVDLALHDLEAFRGILRRNEAA